ncbi:MAG: DUF3472 domain-containing protein [Puniceicoccaceae bacterium]
MIRRLLLLFAFLPLSISILEAEDRHLKAAYAGTISDVKNITALYREVEILEIPDRTYSAVGFRGGYIGFAMNNPHINFSIWDTKEKGTVIGEARLIKASTRGNPKNHRFGHEGSGYHSELDYAWKPNIRYKVFLRIEHVNDATQYSAYFGEVGKEWHFIATIERPGIHFLTSPGGFIEHVGKRNPQLRRSTAYYGGWVSDGQKWNPITKVRYSFKDPSASNGIFKDNGIILQIGEGIQSQYENKRVFTIEPLPLPDFPVSD